MVLQATGDPLKSMRCVPDSFLLFFRTFRTFCTFCTFFMMLNYVL